MREKLDQMREIVDEKLQETLEKRITASFEIVSKQLQDVHSGLGEMKNIADDVGGLKKVLLQMFQREEHLGIAGYSDSGKFPLSRTIWN